MTNIEARNAAARINRQTFAIATAEPTYVQIHNQSGRFRVYAHQLHAEHEVAEFIERCQKRANVWALAN